VLYRSRFERPVGGAGALGRKDDSAPVRGPRRPASIPSCFEMFASSFPSRSTTTTSQSSFARIRRHAIRIPSGESAEESEHQPSGSGRRTSTWTPCPRASAGEPPTTRSVGRPWSPSAPSFAVISPGSSGAARSRGRVDLPNPAGHRQTARPPPSVQVAQEGPRRYPRWPQRTGHSGTPTVDYVQRNGSIYRGRTWPTMAAGNRLRRSTSTSSRTMPRSLRSPRATVSLRTDSGTRKRKRSRSGD